MKAIEYILVILTIMVCVAFFSLTAKAQDLTFGWTPNTDDTEGYYLYTTDGSSRTRVQTVPGIATERTTYTQEDESSCVTFFLTAFNDDMESAPSDTATWCPGEIPVVTIRPGQPTTFIIEAP